MACLTTTRRTLSMGRGDESPRDRCVLAPSECGVYVADCPEREPDNLPTQRRQRERALTGVDQVQKRRPGESTVDGSDHVRRKQVPRVALVVDGQRHRNVVLRVVESETLVGDTLSAGLEPDRRSGVHRPVADHAGPFEAETEPSESSPARRRVSSRAIVRAAVEMPLRGAVRKATLASLSRSWACTTPRSASTPPLPCTPSPRWR